MDNDTLVYVVMNYDMPVAVFSDKEKAKNCANVCIGGWIETVLYNPNKVKND